MDALRDIANLLIQTLCQLFLLALIMRVLLQLARADSYNPISQFLIKVTQPLLKPIRRFIPSIGKVDTATLIAILLIQMLTTAALVALQGYSIPNPLDLLIWAVLGTLGMLINIYFIAILASIIISWVAPGSYNPLILLLHQLTEPVMAPFRKIVPAMGGLDLSPIFVFLTINVLQIMLGHIAASVSLPVAYVIGI
ncbi:YGGT family protein [marine gamma proteobacterium HTCC2143]|jgi:YggT family protein|uniref:YGGT family protein n=1 Tax=marine gamma proteobacterium HTCC2143 TaxID=247633 RepID=A0Y9P0_9GAMM|nr:YGGT family protein [marine gamma proteobacterium HTCC2143]|tara:strand:+ start:214 stop:801 length:588 start_codon:yes stop_codon:yes gene_type:complete